MDWSLSFPAVCMGSETGGSDSLPPASRPSPSPGAAGSRLGWHPWRLWDFTFSGTPAGVREPTRNPGGNHSAVPGRRALGGPSAPTLWSLLSALSTVSRETGGSAPAPLFQSWRASGKCQGATLSRPVGLTPGRSHLQGGRVKDHGSLSNPKSTEDPRGPATPVTRMHYSPEHHLRAVTLPKV